MALGGLGQLLVVWLLMASLSWLSSAGGRCRVPEEARSTPEALFSDSELLGGDFRPVPVWTFTQGVSDVSDLGGPQFSCSNSSMSLLLRLVRHSDLYLSAGTESWLLPESCGASVQPFGSWLFVTLPYSGCPVDVQISNGTQLHQLTLRYFDHLLQTNLTAVASCQSPPAAGRPPVSAAVRCRARDVRVKLPVGTRLQSVKAGGGDGVVGTELSMESSDHAVTLHVSRVSRKDPVLELVLTLAGEVFSVLAVCEKSSSGSGRGRQRRAPDHKDQLDVWDDGSCIMPTTPPSCVEPTTAPSCVEPTTAPHCIEPTTPPSCIEPTTAPHCIEPTTPPSCIEPTTAPSCIEPTTAPSRRKSTTRRPRKKKPTTTAVCTDTTPTQQAEEKHPVVGAVSHLLCSWFNKWDDPLVSSMHFILC